MQEKSKVFDDLSRLASGAAGVFGDMRSEVESFVRQKLDTIIVEMDLVTREEFEAVRAVAMEARSRQEDLERKIAELEAKIPPKTKS